MNLKMESKLVKRPLACIDLFCGAGGLTHGLDAEGIDVIAGFDLDPNCRYPYEQNNKAGFYEADVSSLSSEYLANFFPTGSIRMIAGCAPCQPFSTYTQGTDTRNGGQWGLLYEFQRFVTEIKPELITMENVPSIQRHDVFLDFINTLEQEGYYSWSGVVDCSKYGVPQARHRMVLLASRFGPIEMAPPTTKTPITVRDAIGNLSSLSAGDQDSIDPLHTSSSLSPLNLQRIKASKPGGSWRDWPSGLRASCHSRSTGKTYASVYGRMEWNKPAPTMTTQCYGFGNGRFGHPEQNRAISLREAAIFQGFPSDYKFAPPEKRIKFTTIGRLIGNAVPVGLGRAIARSINQHLEVSGLSLVCE